MSGSIFSLKKIYMEAHFRPLNKNTTGRDVKGNKYHHYDLIF